MKFTSLLRSTAVGALALFAAGITLPGAAKADLVLINSTTNQPTTSVTASFTDVGAQGFGNVPRLLTLQTNGVESGFMSPVNQTNGDAVGGANKGGTPTLSALGWLSGAAVGIGFNSDQVGQTGITMQDLVLTLYNGTTAVDTFSLASSLKPLQFTAADLALQQGNGNAVFAFGLTASQQTEFNTDVAQFGTGLFAGLGATLGCATNVSGCQVSNDGPDSFVAFVRVPGPVVGAGLPGLVMACGGLLALARRRRQRLA